ncbi:MAG: enolase C-terminal domain-like protein [Bacteroidota bacterium]
MKIDSLTVRRLQIPLKTTFSQANNSTSLSDSMIAAVTTTSGIWGYGESCPRPYVTGEDPASVIEDIRKIQPALMNQTFEGLEDIQRLLQEEFGRLIRPAALCTIELALLDAWAKTHQQSVLEMLGGAYREHYQYCAVLPMASLSTAQQLLRRFRHIGFKEIKLKINEDLSLTQQKIALVKEVMGSSTRIRLDVNCAWDLATAKAQIPSLLEAGVTNFEQIFEATQLDQFKEITQEFGKDAQIAVDEGLNGPESAQRLIDEGIGNQFNLKISKHGGILATLDICQRARRHGVGYQLGAHFGETSLLSSAGIIIASLVEDLSSLEGAFGTHLLEYDISTTPLQFGKGGAIRDVSDQLAPYGLGIQLSESLNSSIS